MACALPRNGSATGVVGLGAYSFSNKASGLKHDLTSWLGRIPTGTVVYFPPKQQQLYPSALMFKRNPQMCVDEEPICGRL